MNRRGKLRKATVAGLLVGLVPGIWAFGVEPASLRVHDWWLDAPRVIRALEGAGIRVLEDRAARIDRGGEP